MMRFLIAALVIAWAQTASASALFVFSLTDSTPPGAIFQAEGSIQLSSQAFGQGITIAANESTATPNWAALGIEVLSFTTNGHQFGLADLQQAGLPPTALRWNIALQSSQAGTPVGTISFNTSAWDVTYRLAGLSSSGSFNTDGPGACTRTGACSFTGTFAQPFQTASIPEPASALLLAAGLLGLSLTRRRAR